MQSYMMLLLILLPLLTSGTIRLFSKNLSEKRVIQLALTTAMLHSLIFILILTLYLLGWEFKFHAIIWKTFTKEFSFNLNIDPGGLVLLGLTSFMAGTVFKFSQTYMHREFGFYRFFSTLNLFVSGMTLISIAYNLETFFIGWEIVGISSFLLIGFYRNRLISIRNALKAFVVYRVCDVGLIVSVLLEHEYLQNFTFSSQWAPVFTDSFSIMTLFLVSFLLILSAAGKSAQFPFSYWLPRALEGPTPSSAIFYGALSIHTGVFLLYRTYSIWSSISWGPYVVGAIGLITTIFSSGSGRVQSTIKGQIAYASIAQVGIMFLLLAFGFKHFVLFYIVVNAIVQCYQLLISPSVAVYLLRKQNEVGHFNIKRFSIESYFPKKIHYSLYVFSMMESYYEPILKKIFVRGLNKLYSLIKNNIVLVFATLQTIVYLINFNNYSLQNFIFAVFIFFGFYFSLHSLLRSRNINDAILYSSSSMVIILLSVIIDLQLKKQLTSMLINEMASFIFLVVLFSICFIFISKLNEFKWKNFLLFILVLSLIGFPISPLFFKEDPVMEIIHHNQVTALFTFVLVMIFNGISLIGNFSKDYILKIRKGYEYP